MLTELCPEGTSRKEIFFKGPTATSLLCTNKGIAFGVGWDVFCSGVDLRETLGGPMVTRRVGRARISLRCRGWVASATPNARWDRRPALRVPSLGPKHCVPIQDTKYRLSPSRAAYGWLEHTSALAEESG
jgi:hypothetical protein